MAKPAKEAAKPKNPVAVIEKKVSQIELAASSLKITDQASYDKAGELLLLAKAGQAQAMDMFDPQRAAAWESYQIALKQLNKYKDPFISAEKTIKAEQSRYLVEQDRLRQEEQDRLQREAEEKAAKERDKLLKKAAKAKTEEKREELEEAAGSVIAYAPTVASPVITNVEGVGHRMVDAAEVTDPMELIKAIASGRLKINLGKFIKFHIPTLENYIKLTGDKTIPGVKVSKSAVISASKGGR